MNRKIKAVAQGAFLGLLFCFDFSGEAGRNTVKSFFPDNPMLHDARALCRNGALAWRKCTARRSVRKFKIAKNSVELTQKDSNKQDLTL